MSKTTTIFYESPSVKQQLYNPMLTLKDLLSQVTIWLEIKENIFL